jgi:uncharacterized membrane-anchored protein
MDKHKLRQLLVKADLNSPYENAWSDLNVVSFDLFRLEARE